MKNKITIILILLFSSQIFSANCQTLDTKNSHQNRIKLKANYGYGYIFPKLASGLDELEKERVNNYRSGINNEISAHYLFQNKYGLGLANTRFLSDHTTTFLDLDVDGDGRAEDGNYHDDVTINLIGLSFMEEILNLNNKFYIIGNVVAGLLTYKSVMTYTNSTYTSAQDTKLDGSAYGYQLSFDFEWAISKKIRLNISPSALLGTFSKMKYDGTKKDLEEKENVSRVNISAGISIYM